MIMQAQSDYPSARVLDCIQIGSFLRRRRHELGYTQREVAEMLGYSIRLIGELERGRESVGIGRVLAYATGLGIDLTFAVRGKS